MSDKFYEMLWNCESCGTKGLFAKSQKHCPLCGSAQNPEKRFFPEEGEEVEIQGHQYAGADWLCPYCQSPNGAAAMFCGCCGGPKDGSKEVKVKQDPAAIEKVAEPVEVKPPSRGRPWFKIILALLLILGGIFLACFLWKSEEIVKITALNWSREIDIEKFVSAQESEWCSDMPQGAYSVRTTQEEKSKRQVPDGETCSMVKVDKGDGTFAKNRECKPKFKEVPEMAAKCHFRINQWKVARTDKAEGSKGTEVQWPASAPMTVSRSFADSLGNERLGDRRETYVAALETGKGEVLNCELKPEIWSTFNVDDRVLVKVRISGGVDCDEIRRP